MLQLSTSSVVLLQRIGTYATVGLADFDSQKARVPSRKIGIALILKSELYIQLEYSFII